MIPNLIILCKITTEKKISLHWRNFNVQFLYFILIISSLQRERLHHAQSDTSLKAFSIRFVTLSEIKVSKIKLLISKEKILFSKCTIGIF